MSSLSFQDEKQRWALPNNLPAHSFGVRRTPRTQEKIN